MEVTSLSTQDTKELAKVLASKIKPNDVLALYGDLGSGKTTFTSYFVSELGIQKRVQSPTFVIHRRYISDEGSVKIVNHLDLYRITNKNELRDLNVDEILDEPNAIAIIEWPEIAQDLLPTRTITLKFKYIDETTREINVQNLH